jgi:hypothetical protein
VKDYSQIVIFAGKRILLIAEDGLVPKCVFDSADVCIRIYPSRVEIVPK